MPISVTLIGGGMIAHDQLLPSLYQLQRQGLIGEITICGQRGATLAHLAASDDLHWAFPGQSFQAIPGPDQPPEEVHPHLYHDVIKALEPGNIVMVALPDHLHADAILRALRAGQHVITVKPMVQTVAEGQEIEAEAWGRGLAVVVEYHKRFDYRSLMARRRYREGMFGEFRMGSAALFEKWHYRHSSFQNWCTTDNSDAFSYVGCHYVDLVHFITGLRPVAVSVAGIRDRYPNGNEGFLWTDARVRWENGAILNVQNGLGFPDAAPGSNTQGLRMYCSTESQGAFLAHDDQYRGLQYSYVQSPSGLEQTQFSEPSPDYFQYVDLGEGGQTAVGYGFRSVECLVKQCLAVAKIRDLAGRRALLRTIDETGLVATPANSRYNDEVIEVARRSILNDGVEVPLELVTADSVR